MKKTILIALFGFAILFQACSQENKTMKNKTYNVITEYPYDASEQRANIIFDNMNKLKLGMNKKGVIKLLTLPDEINATYLSNVTGKDTIGFSYGKDTIGFSYVYIIKRNQILENLIRIHFDLNKTLISAYATGIPKFNEIEKVTINTDIALPGSETTIYEAIKRSMIIPISETQEIKYHKPIIAKCIAAEDTVEPGQIIVVTCYYYQKFNLIEIISGEINDIFEGDYITYIPVNEDKIVINSTHILILRESHAEGKYHLVKVLYDTETNRQEIKSSIDKLSNLINN